jgi:hypothetical protein
MQHHFCLPARPLGLDSWGSLKRRLDMGLARPLNALFLCAALGFIGALVMGFIA